MSATRALTQALGLIVALSVEAVAGADAPCARRPTVVAIDAGHSAARPGATSARGRPEYLFNRQLSEELVRALTDGRGTSAFLVAERGETVGLAQRARRVQARQADLLISIHHDSVQPVYLLPWTNEGTRQRYSDRYQGFSLFVSRANGAAAASRALAERLGDALLAAGMTPSVHHAERIPGERRELADPARGIYWFDELGLLRSARMPAVLLEAGIIVNRQEEERLSDPAYRARLVSAIVTAIERYCVEASQARARTDRRWHGIVQRW